MTIRPYTPFNRFVSLYPDEQQSSRELTKHSNAVTTAPFNVSSFGAKGDGITDDLPAFTAAMAAVVAAGGGDLALGAHCYAITSGNLVVPSTVRLVGDWWPGSQSYLDYRKTPYTLALGNICSIVMSSSSALEGLIIVRQGVAPPTSVRTAQMLVNSFAGTAIIIGPGALDVDFCNLAVFGFDMALDMPTSTERVNAHTMLIDCTNGLRISNSHDISRFDGIHIWPFLTANFPWVGLNTAAITNVSNNSGAIQITTVDQPTAYLNGDTILVHDVSGVPGANGKWRITVLDPNNFVLDGSIFSGVFGAVGFANTGLDIQYRDGTAFEVLSGEVNTIINSFSYGHRVGFHIGTGAGWTQLIGCSADGTFLFKDPTTIALLVDGDAYGTTIIGGVWMSHGTAMVLNSTATSTTTVIGATIDPSGNYNPVVVSVLQGRVVFSSNTTNTSVSAIFNVSAALGSLVLSGNDFGQWSLTGPQQAINNITGTGNIFGSQPLFGNIAAANVSAGQFAYSTTVGLSSAGTDAVTASPVNTQRIYVTNTNIGTGINLTGFAIGADVIVWNGGVNSLFVYADTGASTIGGSASQTIIAGAVIRLTKVAPAIWLAW